MRRHLGAWVSLAACVALACGALGWLSVTTWRMERGEAEAQAKAELEERVRLALWRMDARMTRLIAQESSRPVDAWDSFYVPAHAFDSRGQTMLPSTTRIASPLLLGGDPGVQLHFVVSVSGGVQSPQAPSGAEVALALRTGVSEESVALARARVDALTELIDARSLWKQLPDSPLQPETVVALAQQRIAVANAANETGPPEQEQLVAQAAAPQQLAQVAIPAQQQQSVIEYGKRQSQYMQNSAYPMKGSSSSSSSSFDSTPTPTPAVTPSPEPARAPPPKMKRTFRKVTVPVEAEVEVSSLIPLWSGDELLLVRRVERADRAELQGVWLDWAVLQPSLLEEIQDLLPAAKLEPVRTFEPGVVARQLASLPVRLVPGSILASGVPQKTSTLPWILLAAWTALGVALVSVGVALAGAISLSERRGAFVSAVTHELRTPLTTFRMYAEMLAEGMVASPEQRQSYYETLRGESNRLAHLVENVLSYAKLERRRPAKEAQPMEAGAFVRDNLRRSEERALDAGMELVVEPADAAHFRVLVDPSAGEQVLFNLVDNACKYAREATDRRLHIGFEARGGGRVAIVVRDHGPGVPKSVKRHLFEPFSKSSEEAADSAPGVGLGLALCRRLARAMGGDLRYEGDGAGARFAFVLRRAP